MPDLTPKTDLKVGQSVLASGSNGAVTGIITKIDEIIHTNLTGVAFGSSAVSSSGNIIGIALTATGEFAGAERITALLIATSTTVK